MTKTFKSPLPDSSYKFEIGKNVGAEHLFAWISGGGVDSISMALAPSDAPALALAILEAAGYGEEVVTDGSPDGHIQVAKYYLYEGVKAHASITAEARELAELEAEALELFNVVREHDGEPRVATWGGFHAGTMEVYLLLARRARELAKEATK